MAISTGSGKGSVNAEINVTPMVDVMLVLLIIFMVTAPLLSAGVQVNLPKANAKSLSQNDAKPLEVTIDAGGQIYLGETKVTLDRLTGMRFSPGWAKRWRVRGRVPATPAE